MITLLRLYPGEMPGTYEGMVGFDENLRPPDILDWNGVPLALSNQAMQLLRDDGYKVGSGGASCIQRECPTWVFMPSVTPWMPHLCSLELSREKTSRPTQPSHCMQWYSLLSQKCRQLFDVFFLSKTYTLPQRGFFHIPSSRKTVTCC